MRTFILTKKAEHVGDYSELSKFNGLVVDSLEEITRRIDKCVIYFPETFAEKCNEDEISLEDTFIATIYVRNKEAHNE